MINEEQEEPKKVEDWEINIRSDLWSSMDISQLNIQRELILQKIILLYKLGSANQTARDILIALQRAQEQLNALIDEHMTKDPKKRTII